MQKKTTTFSSQRLLFYLSCLLDFRENSLTMRQESEHCSFLFRFFRSFLFPLECFVCLKENSLLCMSCRRERERETFLPHMFFTALFPVMDAHLQCYAGLPLYRTLTGLLLLYPLCRPFLPPHPYSSKESSRRRTHLSIPSIFLL